jgi:hypothetical protein
MLGEGRRLLVALTTQFERKLNDLMHRRVAHLLALVRNRQGRPKVFTKRRREQAIREIEALAAEVLRRRLARPRLDAVTERSPRHAIRGRGLEARFKHMSRFAKERLRGPIIYSFWRGNRCLYVGQGKSPARLGTYRKSAYLREATSLRVRMIRSRSHLTTAECLSVHLFEPRDNLVKAARRKYSKSCPICRATKEIRKELLDLLRLR